MMMMNLSVGPKLKIIVKSDQIKQTMAKGRVITPVKFHHAQYDFIMKASGKQFPPSAVITKCYFERTQSKLSL